MRIQGAKYQSKTANKNLLLTNSKSLLTSGWFIKFYLKNNRKRRKIIRKFFIVKKSVNLIRNVHDLDSLNPDLDLDPDSFFCSADPGFGSASKVNV